MRIYVAVVLAALFVVAGCQKKEEAAQAPAAESAAPAMAPADSMAPATESAAESATPPADAGAANQ